MPRKRSPTKSPSAPDLVMRPAGIWDSRSPLHSFLLQNRRENRTYYGVLLALSRVMHDARKADPAEAVSKVFKHKAAGELARRAWPAFRKSFPPEAPEPTAPDIIAALGEAIPEITEHAVGSHCALFELFCQCWALNILLAKLESGAGWNSAERELARMFWTIKTDGYIPSFYDIAQRMPVVRTELEALPHVFKVGEAALSSPARPGLTAFAAVQFWRAWRNLLTHASGFVSMKFEAEHRPIVIAMGADFPMPTLMVGSRLSLTHAVFRAVAAVHHRAAHRLNELLLLESQGRRGHEDAPATPRTTNAAPPLTVPRMLVNGDHSLSLKWQTDMSYRAQLRSAL
jgi:hypothetical protein